MPSHRVHALVGELVCGFSSEEVDNLVDRGPSHDLSRVSCRKLLSLASVIYEKYGDKGLCYLALHHYLDKLVSVMRGRIVKLMYGQRFDLLVREVAMGLWDEVSTLSVLTSHEHLLYLPEDQLTAQAYFYRRTLQGGYTKQTARRKADLLEELARKCREDLASIGGPSWWSDFEFRSFLERIRKGITSARAGVGGFGSLKKIMCILLAEDKQYWIRQLGQQLYDKVIASLNCSGDSPKGV